MARRGLIGLMLALLFAPAAAANPHGHEFEVEVVTKKVTVEGGGELIESMKCPEGFTFLAPHWEVLSGEGFVGPLTSPFGSNAVYLMNNVFSREPSVVEIGMVCARPKAAAQGRGDSHIHEVKQVFKSKELTLPGRGEFTEASVACPNGFSAMNGFLNSDRRARSELSRPSADGKGWEFGISNLTNDAETTATAQVQCMADTTGPAKRLKKKKNCGKIKNRQKRRKCRKDQRKQQPHRHEVEREVVEQKVPVESSPTPQEEGIKKDGEGACPKGTVPVGIGWNFLGHPFAGLNAFTTKALNATFGFTIFNRSTELEAILQTICIGTKTGRSD